jgi:pre-mRNA-splicing factor ATP-dependent RNA helicase DHX16
MMSDQELHHWVSDKLHETMGMSDKIVVDFLITTARKTHNVGDFTSKLSTVLEGDGDMSKVAHEIWSKVPRKSKGENANRVKERAAVQQQQINASFKMLLSDDDDDDSPVAVAAKQKKAKKKKKKKKSSSEESDNSDNDEESNSKKIKYRKKKVKKAESDASDGEEQRRLDDLKERDEFTSRLKEKDKDRTRNVVEKTDSKAFREAKKRLQLEEEDRRRIMPELRHEARKECEEA